MQPLSFETMKVLQNAGSALKEIIIKEQHNCEQQGIVKQTALNTTFYLLYMSICLYLGNSCYANPHC